MATNQTIYIGADHNGFALKQEMIQFLTKQGYQVVDLGPKKLDPLDDFPQPAAEVALAVLSDKSASARGILLCGSGQGVCMAANRFKGVRAALGYDDQSVRSSRNDDDSNILCLAGRELTIRKAQSLTTTWLNTAFAGASRFKRRIKQMDKLN